MLPRPKNISLIFLQLTSILFLCSCGIPLQQMSSEDVVIHEPGIRGPIPLHAGLYFRKSFLNFTFRQGNIFEGFFMGEALSGGAEEMLKNIFERVTIISPTDTEKEFSEKNIDVIVTPTLIDMNDNIHTARSSRPYVVQIIIQWNIVSPGGKDIYFNKIIGESRRREWNLTPAHSKALRISKLKDVFSFCLVDQFTKAQEDIYSTAWWRTQWWRNDK